MRRTVPIRASEIAITDDNFLRETWRQSWHELALLLAGSIIVVVSFSPAFLFALLEINWLTALWCTIVLPPFLAGYSYMIGRNSVGYKPRLSDIVRGARAKAVGAILSCLPVSILAVMAVTGLRLLGQSPPQIVVIGIMVNFAALFLATLLTIYVLPLMALFNLPVYDAWRDGLFLVVRWPYVAFGLAALLFLLAIATNWLGLGFALIMPMIFVQFTVNATLMLTKRAISLSAEPS